MRGSDDMLQVIAGRSGSGKTEMIHRCIRQCAEEKEIIFLVPEQSTFQNEKRILDALGAQQGARVKVLSFKRLYDTVTDEYGGHSLKRIDDGAKAVLMSLAAEEISEQLVLYASRSKRNDFAELMLNAVNEFKMCAITPEELAAAASKTDNLRLRQKLKESAAIYAAYDALLHKAYADPDDDMTRLYEMLQERPFFSGKTVFIDSFNGFSGQEKKVLECILYQAESVYIALCCDRIDAQKAGHSVLQEPHATLRWITMTAEKLGVKTEPIQWLEKELRYRSPSLSAIEASVFRFDGDSYDYKDDAVQIYEAEDEYDEVRQVARQISLLVREKGYAYRDITVIFRNPAMYKSIIASEFPKFDIPFFMSDPQLLEEKPLIRLILSAFEIIHSSFSTESILTYLKTDLTNLFSNDVYLLENYVYLWNIRGGRWKSPFTMNPAGNTEKINEKELAYIENLRQKVMKPLTEFSDNLAAAKNGAEISKAVYGLLKCLKTDEKMRQLVLQFDEADELKQKELEARIWDITMALLDKMYTVLSDTPVDSRRYYELLKLMVRKNPLSDIPQTLDHVVIGTAGNIRTQAQKAVFIIGALEGVFPAVPAATGIFSDSERTALLGMSLPLYDALEGFSQKEKFNAYDALSLPSEKLFVSRCLSTAKGESCEPSVIIKEIEAILPNVAIKRYSDLPVQERFFTKQQSFEECAALWQENSAVSASLKAYFRESEDYSSSCGAIGRMRRDEPYRLTSSEKAKQLFGEKLSLSASQTEVYYQCPFQYFCRYGLKAYPRKRADMNAGMYGSAVHFVLEQIMKNEGAEQLKTADNETLSGLIDKYIEEYLKGIGGTAERTSRFMAQLQLIKRNLCILLKRVIAEMKAGSFVTADFELNIGPQGSIPAYELKIPSGETINIVGIVDRVDTYVKDNCKYIRIVDYKTGNKKFRLSDVLYGLNIQMLLYLSIIRKNGTDYYSENHQYDLLPAGILYMPSAAVTKTKDYHSDQQRSSALKQQQASFRMNGLLLNDKEILTAMESDGAGIFIPAKFNKDGSLSDANSSLADLESYGHIFSYIDKKLIQMAQALYKGNIDRLPVKGRNTDGCIYCDYRTVCGFEEGKKTRPVTNLSLNDAIAVIDKEEGTPNE